MSEIRHKINEMSCTECRELCTHALQLDDGAETRSSVVWCANGHVTVRYDTILGPRRKTVFNFHDIDMENG